MLSKILGGTPIHRKEKTKMRIETEEYMTIQRREEVRAEARKLRKQFLRYKEAEIVYSMQHKKLLELADRAGALYRIDVSNALLATITSALVKALELPIHAGVQQKQI